MTIYHGEVSHVVRVRVRWFGMGVASFEAITNRVEAGRNYYLAEH
jgi:hypothetical protein